MKRKNDHDRQVEEAISQAIPVLRPILLDNERRIRRRQNEYILLNAQLEATPGKDQEEYVFHDVEHLLDIYSMTSDGSYLHNLSHRALARADSDLLKFHLDHLQNKMLQAYEDHKKLVLLPQDETPKTKRAVTRKMMTLNNLTAADVMQIEKEAGDELACFMPLQNAVQACLMLQNINVLRISLAAEKDDPSFIREEPSSLSSKQESLVRAVRMEAVFLFLDQEDPEEQTRALDNARVMQYCANRQDSYAAACQFFEKSVSARAKMSADNEGSDRIGANLSMDSAHLHFRQAMKYIVNDVEMRYAEKRDRYKSLLLTDENNDEAGRQKLAGFYRLKHPEKSEEADMQTMQCWSQLQAAKYALYVENTRDLRDLLAENSDDPTFYVVKQRDFEVPAYDASYVFN